MRSTPVERCRNVGLVAHIDAGKTTATERMLHLSGESDSPGEVGEGTTVTDWMAEEQRRGISITAAVVTFGWRGHRINVIDTPGHLDFTGEVERSLGVLDGAAVILCAVGGVEPQARTVWRQADRHRVPRVVFVNKMDRAGADFGRVLRELEDEFGATLLPAVHPLGSGESFRGVADLVEWDPASVEEGFRDEVEFAREGLLEAVAELDDEFLARYLEGGLVAPELLRAALRRITLGSRGSVALCGAALGGVGISSLLDSMVDYLPSPAERTGLPFEASDEAELAAVVFKVMTHPRTGRLCYTRIFSGSLGVGDRLALARGGAEIEIKSLYRMRADEAEPVAWAGAGDIVAIGSLDIAVTGDTIHGIGAPVKLAPMSFPDPVVAVSLEPAGEAVEEELEAAATLLAVEDPTLRLRRDEATGLLTLAGIGELHLEVAVARLTGEFKVPVRVSRVKVEYRESVRSLGEARARIGREGLSATASASVEPAEGSNSWSVEAAVTGERLEAVRSGIQEALDRGFVSGWPVTGVGVVVAELSLEGGEAALPLLKAAVAEAVAKAASAGGTLLCSPSMELEIQVPEEFVGAVLAQLKARGALITGLDERSGERLVRARAGLDRLEGFATELRSRTKGRAGLAMQPVGYEPAREPPGR